MSDPFSTAREGFVKMDDVLGRLLLIQTQDSGERQSTQKGAKDGEVYIFVETDTTVLDGDVSEMIDTVPMVLESFQFSGQTIVGQLLPQLKKFKAGGGTGMVLGRLTQKPSSYKTPMWVLAEPTDADKAMARKWLDAEKARKAEQEPADPFAV